MKSTITQADAMASFDFVRSHAFSSSMPKHNRFRLKPDTLEQDQC
jgi:hypothetical protein